MVNLKLNLVIFVLPWWEKLWAVGLVATKVAGEGCKVAKRSLNSRQGKGKANLVGMT